MSWDESSQLSSSEDGSDDGTLELHDACEIGALDLVQQLLTEAHQDDSEESEEEDSDGAEKPKHRVDINKRDRTGCTPLHVALLFGHDACVKALLDGGAELNLPCNNSPPLHLAVCAAAFPCYRDASLRALDTLLEEGADVRSRDDLGRTPLHWAAAYGNIPAISRLLAAAADPDQLLLLDLPEEVVAVPPMEQLPLAVMQDIQGDTSLHLAARHCHPAAVAVLLTSDGASPGVLLSNKMGLLPLHMAAKYGDVESAKLLLPLTPSGRTVRGKTAADIVRQRGHHAMLQLLDPSAADAAAPEGSTEITPGTTLIAPPECWLHKTCADPIIRSTTGVPVENVNRLRVLTHEGEGILRTVEFSQLRWQESVAAVAMSDVLRVHEWAYVKDLEATCNLLESSGHDIGNLDGDTALSHSSFTASLKAAGAACRAVDEVVTGHSRNVFCAIRPPGHHAGPLGVVNSEHDPHGSHGFCLLNNAAIAAAYAMNRWRSAIKRVAILDFDVHHGNGTQSCVGSTVPTHRTFKFSTPMLEGSYYHPVWHPWYDRTDRDNILFASVQGYGRKHPSVDVYVYPGSGATCDTLELRKVREREMEERQAEERAKASLAGGSATAASSGGAAAGEDLQNEVGDAGPTREQTMETDGESVVKEERGRGAEEGAAGTIPEDPNREFVYTGGEHPPVEGPRIINVGIPGPGSQVQTWRRAWRDKVLPAVVNFKPDLIILSAGFDAHMKDSINYRYINVQEPDFEWLTEQTVRVANSVCGGRIISLLEGGYELDGGVVSAFARSVAAHVRALMDRHSEKWDLSDVESERAFERAAAQEKAAALAAAAAAAAKERVLAVEAGAPGTGTGADDDPADSIAQRRKRRRTSTVDYAQLNAQMDAERAEKAAAAAAAAAAATVPAGAARTADRGTGDAPAAMDATA